MTDVLEKHGVNCYFCAVLFDEREGQNADDFNDNDGGTICPKCLAERKKNPGVVDDDDIDDDKGCENCGGKPVWPSTGMCGPCTTGEAATVGLEEGEG